MKKLYALLVALILALCLAGCGDNNDNNNSSSEPPAAEPENNVQESPDKDQFTNEDDQQKPADEASFKDNVVTTDDLKIEITEHKVIQPGDEGNQYGSDPIIAFWYEVTNLSDDEIDPTTSWLFAFSAYQGDEELSVSPLPDNAFVDTQLNSIGNGESIKNAVGYTLTDETTPVTLKATKGLMGADIGEQEYSIS